MKWRTLAFALVVVAPLLACQFFTRPPGRGTAPAQATNLPGGATPPPRVTATSSSGLASKYQYIFKPPTNPIHLSVSLDKAHQAAATIPVKGGQLQATGADGTHFVLDISPNALTSATVITLTPVSRLSGQPFDGQATFAAQLEPEGLFLYGDAVLTITPAKPITSARPLFFGYQAGGKTVGLALPVVDSKELKIRLMHFSGYGVTAGTAAEVAQVQQQLGGDVEAALQSLTAEVLAQMREDQINGTSTDTAQQGQVIVDLMDQWAEEVVKPALEAAGDSCAAGKDAIRKVLGLERMRQLLGVSTGLNGADLTGLISTASKACVKEEYQRCVDEHVINRMIRLYIALMRQYELLGGKDSGPEPEEVQLARDLTAKCLTFELQFHSEGSFDTGDGGYNSTVDGKVMLHFDPSTFTIQGSGPLDNLAFDFRMPKGGKGMSCTADSKAGGSTFEVKTLEYVEDTRSETDPEPYVRDFNLTYFPGVTSESYKVNCILTDSQGHTTTQDFASPPSGYWTGIFFVLHQDELNAESGAQTNSGGMPPMPDISTMLGGAALGALPAFPAPAMPAEGGFFVNDWAITSGDALMASKEWIKNNSSAGLTEAGTLKLYHRPGG